MKGRHGYSLVEVLVAFVIMTVVLAVLIPSQAALLGRASALEHQLLAHDYALSRAARLGYDTALDIGTTTDIYRGWSVETEISQGDVIPTDTDTLKAIITVTNARGQQLALYETLLVAP